MKYTADTSFLIGLFVNELRTEPAKEMYSQIRVDKEKVFVPAQTLVEVIYVLEKFYKLDREKVAEYVSAILGTFNFIVEKYEMFYSVMDQYTKHPSINLGDIIIAEESRRNNISNILTFDRHFEKLGLNVLSSLVPKKRSATAIQEGPL